MASNDVKLGGGNATGMFFHAPEGTALPAYPGAPLTQDVYTQCSTASVYDANEDYYTKAGDVYTKATVTEETFNANKTDYYTKSEVDVWVEVGDITEDGITWSTARDYTPLKNWALEIKRMLPGTDSQTIKAPIMDTTEEAFKTLFGADNVTTTPATGDHGNLITVDSAALNTPTAEAFLFIMKDGDDMIMLGTTSGFISSIDDVSFKGTEGITWSATFSSKSFTLITDDGQSAQG